MTFPIFLSWTIVWIAVTSSIACAVRQLICYILGPESPDDPGPLWIRNLATVSIILVGFLMFMLWVAVEIRMSPLLWSRVSTFLGVA